MGSLCELGVGVFVESYDGFGVVGNNDGSPDEARFPEHGFDQFVRCYGGSPFSVLFSARTSPREEVINTYCFD